MNYVADLGEDKIKLHYNENVYSPEYSSSDTIVVASQLIGRMPGGVSSRTKILDVACGSGFIGIGIKRLHPEVEVEFSDISREALRITKLNAKRNGAGNVICHQADLMTGLGPYHMVVANLPTFSAEDMHNALHGPHQAYFASMTNPLELYERLFDQASSKCAVLVCECQVKYQTKLQELAVNRGYTLIMKTDFSFGFLAP